MLPGALASIQQGAIPGGLKNNEEFAACSVSVAAAVPREMETLLYDPQTSGGLLLSVAAEHAAALQSRLRDAGVPAHIIGSVRAHAEHPIEVR
jgi:selenide,water dikinase